MTTATGFTLADFLRIPEQKPALEFNPDGTITQAAWAYLAAMIDGEGWIGIVKTFKTGKATQQRFRNGRLRPVRYKLRITITNSHRGPMDWLLVQFGGKAYASTKPTGTVVWMWVCSESAQERTLRGVLPYLIVKRENALIGLEFRAALSRSRINRSVEQTTVQEECWCRIGLLIGGGKSRKGRPRSQGREL